MRTLLPGMAALWLASVACAAPQADRFGNPPGCEALVQAHTADPELPVDEAAKPSSIGIPPSGTGELVVSGLVLETGEIAESSVRIEGTKDRLLVSRMRRSLSNWRYTPARVNGCWVPGFFTYSIRAQ